MGRKLLTAILTAALLLGMEGFAACAAEVFDLSREGSITLTMTCGSETVAGGEMTVYRVGDIVETGGSYRFVLTDEFAAGGVELSDLSSSETASALADYALAQGLAGTVKTIGNDGTVAFESLKPGLYLVVQNRAASGYYAALPFLVTVPMYEETTASWEYAVTAVPKPERSKKSGSGGGSSGGSSSGSSSSGSSSSSGFSSASSDPDSGLGGGTEEPPPILEGRLPQTGQLNWPVPVLVILGLLFFSVGWKLCFGEKKECHEG